MACHLRIQFLVLVDYFLYFFCFLQDRDPFYESPDTEVLIGVVHVYLQSLAYMVEVDEQLPITDFKGNERGQLKTILVPCGEDGREIVGEFVDSPEDLVSLFSLILQKNFHLNEKFLEDWKKFELQSENSERHRIAAKICFKSMQVPIFRRRTRRDNFGCQREQSRLRT